MPRSTSRTRSRTAPRAAAQAAAVNPRTLLLAGLGAAVLARREAERLAADAATLPGRLRAGADAAVDTARGEVRKLARSARTRIAPIQRDLDRLGAQIEAAGTQGVAEAAKRLNPLLSRVGLPTIAAPARKAASRAARAGTTATTARRPAKKVAKAARRRA